VAAWRIAGLVVAPALLGLLVSCTSRETLGERDAAVQALDRCLVWLETHRPTAAGAPLGVHGMDAWSWNLFSRLDPRAAVRARAGREAVDRLLGLPESIEPGVTSLSWWALLLREMTHHGLDVSRRRAALAELDLQAVLDRMNPTTAFWTTELLNGAGLTLESRTEGTAVRAVATSDDYVPTIRDAFAVYHEIAPATDLGRRRQRAFDEAAIRRVIDVLPALLRVCRDAGDTDAAAEVLIAAALLDQRDRGFYRDGVVWLLGRQRADGSFRSARDPGDSSPPENARHGVLVGSWALLESLRPDGERR
jgi:hypothetical protein